MNVNGNVLVSVHSTLPTFEFPSNITEIIDGTIKSYCFQDVRAVLTDVAFDGEPTLAKIGSFAFYQCNKLQKIDFSNCKKLFSIGESSFRECSKLKSVIFADDGIFDSIGDSCFSYSGITSFHFPKSFSKMSGSYSLGRCSELKKVTFAPGINFSSFGGFAFAFDRSLTEFVIPKLTSRAEGTLGYANITKLTVEEGSPYYSEYEGNLYSKDFTIFKIAAPQSTHIKFHPDCKSIYTYGFMWNNFPLLEVPPHVTSMYNHAFYFSEITKVVFTNMTQIPKNAFSVSKIAVIILNEGITTIKSEAFSLMDNLKNITIPSTVNNIENAFASVKKPLDIIFNNNTHFTSINGNMVCNSLKTRLILYTGNESVIHVPESIEYVDGSVFSGSEATSIVFDGNRIKSFGVETFKDMPNLFNLEIPSTVEKIERRCFYGSNIKVLNFSSEKVTLGENVMSNSNVTSVVFGTGVSEIPQEAAFNSIILKSVRISSSVLTIQDKAFGFCKSLNEIIFDEGLLDLSIGSSAFSRNNLTLLELPLRLTKVSDFAFSDCGLLEMAKMGKSRLKELSSGMFSNCVKLKSVEYPKDLDKILNRCFMNCGFSVVGIPSSVTEIEANAFAECKNLKTISFDTSTKIQRIVSTSFIGCSNLVQFTFTTGAEESRFSQIDGVLVDRIDKRLCIYPPGKEGTRYRVPLSMAEIGDYAFLDSRLEKIVVGSKVSKMGVKVFEGCERLRSLELEMKSLEASKMTFDGLDLGCGSIAYDGSIYCTLVDYGAPIEALSPCPTVVIDIKGGQGVLLCYLIESFPSD